MFEKLYKYSEIKGKEVEVVYKGRVPYFNNKFRGKCVANPKFIDIYYFDSFLHCLALELKDIPKVVSTTFYITESIDNGHILYLPYRVIDSLNVIKPDDESKLMLFWVMEKKKNIPIDIKKYILQYLDGSELKIPVVELILPKKS